MLFSGSRGTLGDFMFRFLKALGFANIRGNICDPAALLHAKIVTSSLLILKPCALSSFLRLSYSLEVLYLKIQDSFVCSIHFVGRRFSCSNHVSKFTYVLCCLSLIHIQMCIRDRYSIVEKCYVFYNCARLVDIVTECENFLVDLLQETILLI